MRNTTMLDIARIVQDRAVATANAALAARENGDLLSARRLQGNCDHIARIALRAAASYIHLGGDWGSRSLELFQGSESFSSESMEGLVYFLD